MSAMAASRAIALSVQTVCETHVVEAPQMMQIPKRHGVDLLGILVLSNGFLVDIRDRLHFWIEFRLENARERLVRDRRLLERHLAMLGAALLDDPDRLLGPGLEEVDALDQSFEEALDDIWMLLHEAEARRHGGELDHRQRLDVDHLEARCLGEQTCRRTEQGRVHYAVAHPMPDRRRLRPRGDV